MVESEGSATSHVVHQLRARVRDGLEAEYARLCSVDRPALLTLLTNEGVAESTEVLQAELSAMDERIASLHDYLGDLHEPPGGGQPGLGSCVQVDLGAGSRWMLLASLVVPDDDVVAVDSPLGRALLRAYPGETFAFETPEGSRTGRLVAVEGAGAVHVPDTGQSVDRADTSGARTLSKLEPAEALRLLGEVQVGALAFSMLGTPHVEVVNFVFDGTDPVFRIGSSAKLAAVGRGHAFALHVNRVDEHTQTGWSVTLTGHVRIVRGAEAERLTALVVPWAGGSRPYVVRMTVQQVQGRVLAPTP